MACCVQEIENEDIKKRDKEINKLLKQDGQQMKKVINLLLLGAGESGKSTIAKQMRIIHGNGFTEEQRMQFKPIIHHNTFSGIRAILQACNDMNIKLKSDKSILIAKKYTDKDNIYFSGELTPTIAKDFATLWSDDGIQEAFKRRSEYHISDGFEYFMENIINLGSSDYIPSEQDILRTRVMTTGVFETIFDIEGVTFKLIDVGGQRSERKKWIHFFQDVTAIIFCVALSEYDQTLIEDPTQNRMHDSLNLFEAICNSKWFSSTSIILFLNKKDIFQTKIKRTPLSVCFKDYDGKDDWEKASDFIGKKFCSKIKTNDQQVFIHLTCATDTSNIKFVFESVRMIILQRSFEEAGLNGI